MLFSQKRLPLAVAVTAFVAAAPVSAQQLEEVIVTAQKRAENLQDVPISVSTVSAEKIADNTILNFAALADFVPSLHIADAPVNTNIYMRGIGSGNNRGFEQSVGMYLDGVYLGRGRQYRSALMDVERIEVLRGPQGTLFGKNTVAGAINISSASPVPGDDMTGEINASIEENGGQIYEGFIQGGTDTLAVRAAFRYRETDGYVYNAYLDQDEGATEEQGARITVVWEPSDSFSANLKYTNMQRDRDGAASATWKYLSPSERNADVPNRSDFANTAYQIMDVFFPDFPGIAGQDFTTYKDNGYGRSQDDGIGIGLKPENSDDEIENISLNMSWDIGNGTLTSVTGFASYEYFDDVDVDWLPLQFIDRSDQHEYDQFSQELRWASQIGDRFSYTVGAYYDENELDMLGQVVIDTNFDGLFPEFVALANGLPAAAAPLMPQNLLAVLTGDSPLNGIPGYGVYSANQVARNHSFNQETESWAVFAQGTFDLSDTLRVTLGLRYTEEEKDAVSDQKLGDSLCGLTGNLEGGTQGQCGAYNNWMAVVQASSFNTYNKYWVGQRKTDDLSPSVNFQWDMSDSSMLYISYSQGFKSGGFQRTGGLATPYDPETVDTVTLGMKSTWLDGTLRLNAEAFLNDYQDKQLATIGLVDGEFAETVGNVGELETSGAELELTWLPAVDGLVLGLNVGYLDTDVKEYTSGDDDIADTTAIGFSPEWTVQGRVSYEFDLSDWGSLMLGADVSYRTESYTNSPIDLTSPIADLQVQEEHAIWNAIASFRSADQAWRVAIEGKNLEDKRVLTNTFDLTLFQSAGYNMPRTWAVTVGYEF